MATSFTANYAFGKPAKGDVGWWAVINASLDAIDTQLATFFPGGTMLARGNFIANLSGSHVAWNRFGAGETAIVCHGGVVPGAVYFVTTQNASAFNFLARLQNPTVDTNTSLIMLRNLGGGIAERQVSLGGVDSGGPGFRLLRVVNG